MAPSHPVRLRTFSDFFTRAQKRRGNYVTLFVLQPQKDTTTPLLGVIASKNRYRHAVDRHRAKRIIRAFFVQKKGIQENALYVVIPHFFINTPTKKIWDELRHLINT